MTTRFLVEVDDATVRRERAKARELRRSGWWRQKIAPGTCHYCGARVGAAALTMDHVVPLIRGGRSVRGNLVPACKPCNDAKKHQLPFEMELAGQRASSPPAAEAPAGGANRVEEGDRSFGLAQPMVPAAVAAARAHTAEFGEGHSHARRAGLERIHRHFTARPAVRAEGEPAARAAVAMVLAPSVDDLEVLLIQRAEHPGDPWSGHMAFPGGRHDPTDADLVATALRETHEEVGLDLRDGRLVGSLDDLRAVGNGRAIDMVISPFLFTLDAPRPTRPDPREVAKALWIPLRVFEDERHHGTTTFSRDGFAMDFPAVHWEGHTVWGLTYRILRGFFEALRTAPTGSRHGHQEGEE